jgi:hypothetical protein
MGHQLGVVVHPEIERPEANRKQAQTEEKASQSEENLSAHGG